MKGKVSYYYNAPKVAQIKSRLNLGTGENSKSKEFTTKMREIVSESLAEVLNEQILNIRSKAIAKFQAAGFEVKSPKHASELANPLNSFFDVVTSTTPFPSEVGDDTPDDAEAPSEEAKENSKNVKKSSKKTEAPAESQEAPSEKPADDEFED